MWLESQYLIKSECLGSTTVAVAAAMLQNSPPQWFQSSGAIAALKSEYLGHVPRIWEGSISKTFESPSGN